MQVLNSREIEQKIIRLSYEILENNYQEKELILAGINNNGLNFAKLLEKQLKKLTEIKITLTSVELNPAKPLASEVVLKLPVEDVKNKVVIIVDDVANTGRTLFYATKPLFNTVPKKVEIAVLVERHHKSFPMKVDYVGLSLATTLKENIDVQFPRKKADWGVFMN